MYVQVEFYTSFENAALNKQFSFSLSLKQNKGYVTYYTAYTKQSIMFLRGFVLTVYCSFHIHLYILNHLITTLHSFHIRHTYAERT